MKIKIKSKTVSTASTYHVHDTSQKITIRHTPKTPIKNHHATDIQISKAHHSNEKNKLR